MDYLIDTLADNETTDELVQWIWDNLGKRNWTSKDMYNTTRGITMNDWALLLYKEISKRKLKVGIACICTRDILVKYSPVVGLPYDTY